MKFYQPLTLCTKESNNLLVGVYNGLTCSHYGILIFLYKTIYFFSCLYSLDAV